MKKTLCYPFRNKTNHPPWMLTRMIPEFHQFIRMFFKYQCLPWPCLNWPTLFCEIEKQNKKTCEQWIISNFHARKFMLVKRTPRWIIHIYLTYWGCTLVFWSLFLVINSLPPGRCYFFLVIFRDWWLGYNKPLPGPILTQFYIAMWCH